MAVKPLTQPEYWATDAVYTTGPFIGQPQKVIPPGAFAAEGHRPGSLFPTPAEYENSQQYNLTGLARWVFAGSSAGAADAHPLETNATGRTAVTGITVIDPVDETAVVVQGSATILPAVTIGNLTGGSALSALTGNTAATCISAQTGNSTGVGVGVIMAGTLAGGAGVNVFGSVAAAASAVLVNHNGSGIGVEVNALGSARAMAITGGAGATAATVTGGAGQAAMLVSGGNNAAVAAQFIGAGTSLGIVASGGATSSSATGVRGDALHADAVGVHGRTSVSPSAIAAGVTGEARGAGASGVHANGGTVGRGLLVRADTGGAPAYSAMRIIPQSADPSAATQDGEVIWHNDHKTLRTSVATYGYRSMPTMGPGSALIVNATSPTNAADGVAGGGLYSDVLTAICSTADGTGVYGQAAGAEVFIAVSFDVRTNTTATNTINVGLIDVTNANVDIARWEGAGTAGTDGFFLAAPVTEWQRTIVCNVRYPIASDGDLEVKLEVGATGAAAEVRNVSITIMGTF